MNKSIITILLIATIASANCNTEKDMGFDDVIGCINNGSKLVTEVTEYIKAKNWFDGPAVGRIVTALSETFNVCKDCFPKKVMLEAPVELAAYSTTCTNAIHALKASIEEMKTEMRWKNWNKFVTKFNEFGGKARYAKSVC